MGASVQDRFIYSERRIANNRLRRNRELKRRITVFALSLILFSVMAIIFFGTKSQASDIDNPTLCKYYKSVMISEGETLTDLAGTYGTTYYKNTSDFIKEVCYINNLESDNITAGLYLVIPYYSEYRN
ncbi:MAG: hypothetical protein ILP13_05385 [Lachnospiraceae bacterium]|nr:hypothetical protein [Lachnospiraceae bacterium]